MITWAKRDFSHWKGTKNEFKNYSSNFMMTQTMTVT